MPEMMERYAGEQVRAARGLHYGYVVLLLGLLGLAGSSGIVRFAYTMILPAMRDGLGLQNSQMGLIGTVGYLGYLVMTIPGGALASRYGARLIISLSLLVSGVGLVMLGLVHDLLAAILIMLFLQAASSPGNAAGFGFVTAWFAGRTRGTATGVVLGGPGLGMAAVGLFIPLIFAHYSGEAWRWAWYYSGGMTILLAGVCWLLLRNHPSDMGLQPVGAEAAPRAAVRGGCASSSGSALAWGTVYRTPEIWRLGAIAMVHGFVYIIYGTFFAAFVQEQLGLSKLYAGSLWSLVGLLSIFSGLVGGLLTDRLGRTWAITCLYLGQLSAHLLVALFPSTLALYLSLPLYGLTVMGFPAIFGASCAEFLGARLAAAGVGFVIFFFSIGQAVGPYVAGALYDQTGSFTVPFLLACGAICLGLCATWFRAQRG